MTKRKRKSDPTKSKNGQAQSFQLRLNAAPSKKNQIYFEMLYELSIINIFITISRPDSDPI